MRQLHNRRKREMKEPVNDQRWGNIMRGYSKRDWIGQTDRNKFRNDCCVCVCEGAAKIGGDISLSHYSKHVSTELTTAVNALVHFNQ